MARDLDGTIAVRSQKLLGLVTVAHLDALGVSRQIRRSLVGAGVLIPVHRGVYRHAAYPESWRQRVVAALLATGDDALASHAAAAALWRFEQADPAPSPIELSLRPPAQRRSPARVVVHRPSVLPAADVDRLGPIALTSPARTLCDIAPRLDDQRLESVLDHASRRGLIWVPHLRWRLTELRDHGRHGIPRLQALVDDHDRARSGSWLETEGLRRIAEAGLPLPRCQVRLRAGGRRPRVDLFWDHALLVAELNGHATHATRRALQGDAERAAALELEGWRVIAFTYEDVVERPDYVVTTIASHLADRTRRAA